jgi:shikimate kinase
MGVGKTTIGRAVAFRLGFTLCDSDREIERLTGRTIPELFAQEGEPAFRAREREFIETGHPAERCVVACGGGLIVQPGMLELVRSKGVAMCLHASLETILQRTAGHRHRPLLNVDDREERLRTLYAEREPLYRQVGTTILTDDRKSKIENRKIHVGALCAARGLSRHDQAGAGRGGPRAGGNLRRGGEDYRYYVDTGPVLERGWAARAGSASSARTRC